MTLHPGYKIGYYSYDVPDFQPGFDRANMRMIFRKAPGVKVSTIAEVLPLGVWVEDGVLILWDFVLVPF